MLRILSILNGWRNTISGGDYHALEVIKYWSKDNHVSIIIPTSAYEYVKSILHDSCSIYFSSSHKKVDDFSKQMYLYLLRLIRSLFLDFKESPDVVISSSHLLYDIFPAFFLSRKARSKLVVYIPHLFTSSSPSYKIGLWNKISLLIEKISLYLCKKADLVFVVNYYTKDSLIDNGFNHDKVFVTANGIDHEFINSIVADKKNFDACYCGRLEKMKGAYDLVEVWQRVVESFPQAKLVIIGDGSEFQNLLEKIKNAKLDKNIILTGYIPEEKDKIYTMKSSKIFIFPSYMEGWGIAINEAIVCDLPVICYSLPAYDVFGDAIIKVEPGNKEAMAGAIIDVLASESKQMALVSKTKEKCLTLLNWDDVASEQLLEIRKLLNC